MPTGHRLQILAGTRYGRLVVVREAEKAGHARQLLCRCDCGTLKAIRLHDLRSRAIRSCGCLLSEASRKRALRHGGAGSRLYAIWCHMRYRCANPKNPNYRHYGGRGIRVCDEWGDFAVFRDWASANGYRDDLTIERIDNGGGYRPSNCRWATRGEQTNNTRRILRVRFSGETKTLKQWSRVLGIKYTTLYGRLLAGWPMEKAFAPIAQVELQTKEVQS